LVGQAEGDVVLGKELLLLGLPLMAVSQAVKPSDTDWAWLDEQREKAFDAVMPVAPVARQLVAYRSYRDLYQDVLESHFTIDVAEGPPFNTERLTAAVTEPATTSIQQQLLRLHMGDPQAPLERLLPRVTVRRLTMSEDRCPSIRSRLNALPRASMRMPNRNVISLHPFVHRIVIDSGRVRVDATLVDSNDSVVRWAAETLKALQGCTQS
jgi:hypothetical protein